MNILSLANQTPGAFAVPSSGVDATDFSSQGAGGSFGDLFEKALQSVNDQQLQAQSLAKDFAVGKTSDIHGVMIAAEQANLTLQLATQVRNKAVEAYQDVMRITM
jgi:flagellar hook-basal body complex protein FliE